MESSVYPLLQEGLVALRGLLDASGQQVQRALFGVGGKQIGLLHQLVHQGCELVFQREQGLAQRCWIGLHQGSGLDAEARAGHQCSGAFRCDQHSVDLIGGKPTGHQTLELLCWERLNALRGVLHLLEPKHHRFTVAKASGSRPRRNRLHLSQQRLVLAALLEGVLQGAQVPSQNR